MACPAIITGDEFLLRIISHIDCQAQLLGSYGYAALGESGSLASTVMASLLTLFIALFGIRLLFGPPPGARDVVYNVLKIGIVLTLAFSWPAFRTLVHDVVLDGPAQIASTIVTPSLVPPGTGFAQRLQQADVAMVRLAGEGTGRNTGAFIEGSDTGGSFEGAGLQDEATFGYARLAYLAGIISSLGLLRLVAALLLALAPLAAGLLLFEQTRGLFAGWLRGLTLAMLGTVGVTLVLALQLSIIEPWLADALRVRALGYATPSAPIEMFAITAGFALIQLAMIWVLAKVAFNRGWSSLHQTALPDLSSSFANRSPEFAGNTPIAAPSRAQRVADHVETTIRREDGAAHARISYRTVTNQGDSGASAAQETAAIDTQPRLGSSYRRTATRTSRAATRRDGQA